MTAGVNGEHRGMRRGPFTLEPLSANFFHPDQPPLRDVDVVYWFSLESHPVIMLVNIKYVFPSLRIAGASTRFPPSSFQLYTSVVGDVKSSDKATIRSPCLRFPIRQHPIHLPSDRGGTYIFRQEISFPIIILK